MEHREDVGFLFKQIGDGLMRNANEHLRPQALTMQQARVLGHLFRCPDGQDTQKNLENYLHVAHPTVVGILRRLSEKNLVCITADPADRRMRIVRLTACGLRHKALADENHEEIERRIVKGMSDAEVEALRGLLRRVAENVR